MTADDFALAATIVMLLPLVYFLLASLTFLLRPLSDPVVAWLLRELFSVHFLLVAVTSGIAASAFALAGLTWGMLGIGGLAVLAIGARRWFVGRMDTELRARDGGDGAALARLRRLHWGGMLYNATQVSAVVAFVARIFPETT